jgi:tetratricopeptide (TPR) repeat protein
MQAMVSGPIPDLGNGLAALGGLGRGEDGRLCLQESRPFAESLEWELGQAYLRQKGSEAFLHDHAPVPYVINNDGSLSVAAAGLLFCALRESDQAGALEEEIRVLELGVGVGLYARLFLDGFRALCRQHGRDYYDRLYYVAGDYSERMLRDAGRHATFANHPGRYQLRVVDALDPAAGLTQDGYGGPPFRAVFLNYLLDCLPAAVLEDSPEGLRQLCVRTCLARGVDPAETGFGLEGLLTLARSPDPAERAELLEVFPLLAADYGFQPAELAAVPYGEFALQFARREGLVQLVHSYGAIQCLERLLPLVHPQGFILVNDYGQAQTADGEGFEHQRFSGSTFVGVNFPLLRSYFTSDVGQAFQPATAGEGRLESLPYRWAEPAEEQESIHARLVGRDLPAGVVARFQELIGKAATEEVQGPARLARALAAAGRVEAAAAAYRKALERQPFNWVLLGEAARFTTFALSSPATGLALARQALALNPACSAELWNTLGDALFALERFDEAHKAYDRALCISPQDVRAHYNLGFVFARRKEPERALAAIARGLALDTAGEFREGLLQKQAEILGQLAARHRRDLFLMANRTNACPPLPKKATTDGTDNTDQITPRSQAPPGNALPGRLCLPQGQQGWPSVPSVKSVV